MKVLIVEDDILQAKIEQAFLQQGLPDAEINLAFSCQDARKKVNGVKYDMILMDFGLPDGDGLELTKQLRDDGVTSLIIAVSGNLNSVTKAERDAAGLDGGYRKPFTLEDAGKVAEFLLSRTKTDHK